MKDPDKLKLMLLAWNYNLQQAQAQVQAANAALSPNNSSTTTTTTGTPVTSQSAAISTANNTINNSTLTGKRSPMIAMRLNVPTSRQVSFLSFGFFSLLPRFRISRGKTRPLASAAFSSQVPSPFTRSVFRFQ